MADITILSWWEPHRSDRTIRGLLMEEEGRGYVIQLEDTLEDSPTAATAGGPVVFPLATPPDIPILVGAT